MTNSSFPPAVSGVLTEACTQNHKEIAMVHFRPVIQNLQTFINMFESETFLPKRTAFPRGNSMFSTVRTNTVVKLRF